MSLADGQLATTKATIYTVKNAKGVDVSQLFLHNINVAAQLIIIHIKRKGSASVIIHYVAALAQHADSQVLGNGEILSLAAGDEIEAETTTASAVDFLITGKELF